MNLLNYPRIKPFFRLIGLLLLLLSAPSQVLAYSHQYVNTMRSGVTDNMFVHQAIEGEFGRMGLQIDGEPASEAWAGYGFRNGFGIELMKFVQFGAHHTYLNMNNRESSNERMVGSRFSGDVKFVFSAPIINLEMGGGAILSRYDYHRELTRSGLMGTGLYYMIGVNYFMSHRMSFFTQVKSVEEGLTKTSGNAFDSDLTLNTTSIGAGFASWL